MYVVIWTGNESWWTADGFAGYEVGPPMIFKTYEGACERADTRFSDKIVTYDEAMMIAMADKLCT